MHVQAYPTGHLSVVMGKHPFLFTYLVHDNLLSF